MNIQTDIVLAACNLIGCHLLMSQRTRLRRQGFYMGPAAENVSLLLGSINAIMAMVMILKVIVKLLLGAY